MSTLLTKFKVHDLILVIVCAVFVYLLRARESFSLQPSWRKAFDQQVYANGKFPSKHEHILRPIITDVDGDDSMELVLVTNEQELQIGSVPALNSSERRLPDLVIRYSTSLPAEGNPIAMETGYLTPVHSDRLRRPQVL